MRDDAHTFPSTFKAQSLKLTSTIFLATPEGWRHLFSQIYLQTSKDGQSLLRLTFASLSFEFITRMHRFSHH